MSDSKKRTTGARERCMRRWLGTFAWSALATIALFAWVPTVRAQSGSYPNRPVKLVIPYAPGGTSDIIGRRIGQRLGERMGQPVVIDNRAGAGGSIGTEAVARAEPDGYTVLFHSGAVAVDPVSGKKLSYDVQRDLEPITMAVVGPFALLVNAALPVNSVAELIAYAKSNPGKLNFGTPGVGSSVHLTTELFKAAAAIDVQHVPYKGAAPALTALAGNEVQFVFDPMATAKPLVASGRMRALAVSTAQRSGFWPELPTITESGLPGFDLGVWYGVFVPAKTPKPIIDQLNRDFVAALQAPEMREWMRAQGVDVVASSSEGFRERFAAEIARWGELMRKASIKLDQ
jgi:tripartite-type tricarboxylate transporter receptor subunit TctC